MAGKLISSAQLEAVLYANMRFGVFLEGPGVLGIDFISCWLNLNTCRGPAVNLHAERKGFRCHCTLYVCLCCLARRRPHHCVCTVIPSSAAYGSASVGMGACFQP